MVKVVGNGNKTADAFGKASGRAGRLVDGRIVGAQSARSNARAFVQDLLVDGRDSRRSECLFGK